MPSNLINPFKAHIELSLKLVFLVILASCTAQKEAYKLSDEAVLIFNANIIDVANGNVIENQAILIDSGKIQAIGDFSIVNPKFDQTKKYDIQNKFVIPGLWDMHVHFEGEDLIEDNEALLPVFLAYGITTVRDMASDLGEQVLRWRNEINNGTLTGPRIFTAGRKLEGKNSIWKGDLEIENEQELQEMLDKLDGYQVDLVKITENTLPGSLFVTSVREARKRNYLVSGHVPIDASIEYLVDAGISSIEHASYMLRLGSNEEEIIAKLKDGLITNNEANEQYLSNFDQEKAIEKYANLGMRGLAVTPTLIGGKQLAYLMEDDHSTDQFLQYLSKRFVSKYQWRIERMGDETDQQREARQERFKLISSQLPYLQEAGITILAGSDAAALNTFVYPAQSLHDELLLFQEAGLTPLQILQSATINGAGFMGVDDEVGTISESKRADLVILNSNPLEDIKATRDIYAVINKGLLMDQNQLSDILEQARRRKIELDELRK